MMNICPWMLLLTCNEYWSIFSRLTHNEFLIVSDGWLLFQKVDSIRLAQCEFPQTEEQINSVHIPQTTQVVVMAP